MRSPQQLLHGRTRVRSRYALLPLEGFPTSRVPGWNKTEIRIQASPAIGAKFAQYLLNIQPGGGADLGEDDAVSTFFYIVSGSAVVKIGKERHSLDEGGFAAIPPGVPYAIEASAATRAIMFRKRYQRVAGVDAFAPVVGQQQDVAPTAFLDNEHAKLQALLPDDLAFDFAINIFAFDPGHCLPYVETHVMEHGLHFLSGKGLYYLEDEWMEVEADDFIYMAPFCPQSFYATGTTPAKYIYYKDVNRDVEL